MLHNKLKITVGFIQKIKITILFIVVSILLLMVSCKKDEETLDSGKVSFFFNHKIGLQELEFDNLKYINASGHKYEIRTLKYFISNVTFFKSDGGKEVYNSPIYLDAKDSSTLKFDNIQIPTGVYHSIGFTFGISDSQNISGSLNTVKEVAMAWPEGEQGGGYHYMKLEGTYDSLGQSSVNKSYNIHTGPTMGVPYDFEVVLKNSAFTLSDKGLSFEIVMDVNEWFTNPENYNFSDHGQMIMMDMNAQMKLRANGSSVFSMLVID
tara:strand:- start:293 stop:1087 length:795 start_codon:yes stop_codon:yes gene_type:complete